MKPKQNIDSSGNEVNSVAVVMPVYQGEAYLAFQIESILNQTYSGFRLYIRDDGSSDNSLKIIQAYARKDARISFIKNDLGQLGVTRSIKILLANVKENVVFFADQDDIWMPHKIEILLAGIQKEDAASQPVVIFSDLAVVDNNLKEIAPSFWNMAGICPESSQFRQIIRRNCVTGCAAAINKPMLDMIREMPDNAIHDWWIATIAANQGKLIPVSEPLVWYRQHDTNEIGAQHNGWQKFVHLVGKSIYRKKYITQLRNSLVHLRLLSTHPHMDKGFVNRLFLLKERIRRSLFWVILRIFS